MRLGLIALDGEARVVSGDGTLLRVLRGVSTVAEALAAAPDGFDVECEVDQASVRLLPFTAPTSKVICVGLNYRAHILEMGRELPTHPTLFPKYPDTLTGPFDPIELPAASTNVDWEVELAVVVKSPLRSVDAHAAAAGIAGYAVANDISMRDWQNRTTQWMQGKTFAATTPIGPLLVTPDELPGDPARPDLAIRCLVDDDVMQEARTGDLVFSPAELLAYVSEIFTLNPGDVVLTGTPGGVGAGRQPEVYLRAGQTLRSQIEGIGELVNLCV